MRIEAFWAAVKLWAHEVPLGLTLLLLGLSAGVGCERRCQTVALPSGHKEPLMLLLLLRGKLAIAASSLISRIGQTGLLKS